MTINLDQYTNQIAVTDANANASLVVQPKGTGAIDLAAGSNGVNISNGGTVTALTRTANGSTYTSPPTIAISAPTTAGGVQATATSALALNVGLPVITSGGTGYTVGDTLTFVGGTNTQTVQLTVSTVSTGVITGFTVFLNGIYTVLPSNPISVTGGTGTSATFTATTQWGLSGILTITAAGSGYVEQPTVTFSGGGGSGAAAYATVGGATTIKSIGSTSLSGGASIIFQTPSSITSSLPAMRILDGSAGYDSYPQIQPASAYTVIQATGNANAALLMVGNGTGGVRLGTRGTSLVEQMRVSDTASAVNYVQVTGATTGSAPTISAQGSDANVGLTITSKGTLPLYLNTAGITDVRIQPNGIRTFSFSSVSSAVNYGLFTSAAAGFSPALSVSGTDADIDLTLTPKGTGNIRFGTYTGTVLTPTGYITIKDSGGTSRRLLVG